MRVLKIGTKINFKGDEYTVRAIRSIDCGVVVYEVKGPGMRQMLTNLEIGEIDDIHITVKAKECWYYSFEDCALRERLAYSLPTINNGKQLIYCPTIRRVLEEDDMDFVVGKNFDIVLSEKNLGRAKELIALAMHDRIDVA